VCPAWCAHEANDETSHSYLRPYIKELSNNAFDQMRMIEDTALRRIAAWLILFMRLDFREVSEVDQGGNSRRFR